MPFSLWVQANADVPITLSGLQNGDEVNVTISSDAYLSTMSIAGDGNFAFTDVPIGKHFIKVEGNGYNLPESQTVVVNNDGSIDPQIGISLVITKMSDNSNSWTHSWHEDGSTSGFTTTAYVNKPSSIKYLGKQIVPANVPSQSILESEYNIYLSDNGTRWTQEYAYRLLETMKMFPNNIMGNDTVLIQLTNNHITDDIQMESATGGIAVEISTDAFAYANPFLVNLDEVRGRFYSKRLHHAIVAMVTNNGYNRDRADRILRERFGCSIYPSDIAQLTSNTTSETAESFQDFVPRELVEIINMFEEMPEGFHKIKNLKFLIRRQNGHDHPLYPSAAAVTWPQEAGYIEFMEKAFNNENLFETQRLILHEKTHMLWAYTFSDEIKNDWITLGGWYQDPNVNSGWSTTKTTEFVSAYAHAINPNEDMAESVAFYVKDPDMLQSRSLPKYEFIRDRIMHGTRYISKIREDLTFEVLNLYPDYDYPGKIKSLDVQVNGEPNQDKTVIVEITLNHMEGFNDGATRAYLRMTSPSFKDTEGKMKSQFSDLYLYPVAGDAWHLKGQLTLSKYSKSGYWTVNQIKVTDELENQRYEGNNDFVWNMYVNNSMEDLESPVYEKGSLRYNLTNTEVDGHQAQNLEVIYKVTDDTGIYRTFVRLSRGSGDSYTFKDAYGTYDSENHEAHINFLITEFYPTDDYYVSHITFYDLARTSVSVYFSESPNHEPRQAIHITTSNPDTHYPELDLNRIFVYAEPTHPEAPDGETLVTINYYARDNKSGLGKVDFSLRDPQGINHFEYHYHRNYYTNYFDGDPTVWERYTINIVLPKGSAPGIWGLSELTLNDKALNWHTYNFVETLIFEPDENQDDYILFAEMEENDILNFDLTALNSNLGYTYSYRIISEVTGEEIKGEIVANTSNARSMHRVPSNGNIIDVSSLPMGKIVVIVEIKDGDGNIVAVRSKSLTKYIIGDYSGDGNVDVTDYIGIANYIIGDKPTGFIEEAADVNKDQKVDVSDYIGIANMILYDNIYGQTVNAARSAERRRVNTDVSTLDNVIYISPLEAASNGETQVSIKMKNTVGIRGFQFDLYLPEGMTAVKDGNNRYVSTLSNGRKPAGDQHTLTLSEQPDGAIRFLCGSQYDETFTGTDGEIATLTISVAADVEADNYPIYLRNMKLTETDINNYYTKDEIETSVTVTGPADGRVVLDEASTTAPEAANGVDVRVKRTINANEWSTICLPFAMSATQVKAAFGDDVQLGDFTSYDTVEDTGENVVGLTVNFNMVTAMEANHPYVIKVSNAISEFTADNVTIDPEEEPCVEYDNGQTGKKRVVWGSFTGTYVADCVIPYEGDDASLLLSGNKWWYATAQTKHMKGYRAYFWFTDLLPDVSASRIQMAFNDETANVVELKDGRMEEMKSCYNLKGQRVEKPLKKGLYIRNGKKVIIK